MAGVWSAQASAATIPSTLQQAPDPAVFVMAGLVLIGLGVVMKRRQHRQRQ